MENVNDIYFDGYYKEIWRAIIPAELTVRETDFILSYFKLGQDSKVLDIMCGYGRHAIALARKGIAVTAVDNQADYINEIEELSGKEQLPLKAIRADALSYRPDNKFDLALCMGNSLNFYNAADSAQMLSHIGNALNPGRQLLINTWSLAEIAIKQFKEKSWSYVGEYKYLSDSQYLFHPTRIETESIIMAPDGKTETRRAIDYIFSVSEMEALLQQSGFSLAEIFSIPGKKKFTLGEPRAYIVAKKS